jgi:DNA mismatch repair protein MutS
VKDGTALTPVMRQYREAKEQHPEGILLFRLGDFYEVFFEDALIAAPVMGSR